MMETVMWSWSVSLQRVQGPTVLQAVLHGRCCGDLLPQPGSGRCATELISQFDEKVKGPLMPRSKEPK